MIVRRLTRAPLVSAVALFVALAGCSSDGGDPATSQVSSSEAATSDGAVADSTTDETGATDTADTAETTAEPVVRLPVNPGPTEATNWVARTYMDDSQVEIVWSPVDGAENYQLYRLLRDDADYAAIDDGVLTGATLVYEGDQYGYIDHENVPSGVFLTYVLVAEVDGVVTVPRWTEALTVTDTTPPTPIEDLAAEVTDDGVLLSWSPSSDDIEFAAYNVVTLAADGSWQYIGGGADESQTSLIDTDPLPGVNTYEVRAFDFHDNASEPAEIQVDVAAG